MTKNNKTEPRTPDKDWWKGSVFYQIYPRSYADTNNDGVGDMNGITEKMPYIASLGIDGLWISPFYKSPMKDFGYDVSDYRDVDPMFGSLNDFDDMLAEAHKHDIKVIIDLVLSHTSDQHPWFQESKQDRTNPKSDWYVWADPEIDENGNKAPPNNWVSVFDGAAWEYVPERDQYYLRNFLKEQPDLNYHNPEVQAEALDTVKFWLDRGVDGFRLDVVNFYFHSQGLENNPPRPAHLGPALQFTGDDPYSTQAHIYDKSQPENLEFIRRMRALLDSYGATMTVGEIGDDNPYECSARYTSGNEHLHTTYNTQMMNGVRAGLTSDLIRTPVEKVQKYQREINGGYPSWAFSNHDVVRAASRWHQGEDIFSHDPKMSKMLNALLGSLYGTIFMYQGEELGLPEAQIPFEDLQDPWGKVLYHKGWQGRDGCRTGMPWTNESPNAGFTAADVKPWLPIPPQHLKLSVEEQEKDPSSVLSFTREFLKWRKTCSPSIKGDIRFVDTQDDKILAFTRHHEEQEVSYIFNLSADEKTYDLPDENLSTIFESEAAPENMARISEKKLHLPSYGFFIGKKHGAIAPSLE